PQPLLGAVLLVEAGRQPGGLEVGRVVGPGDRPPGVAHAEAPRSTRGAGRRKRRIIRERLNMYISRPRGVAFGMRVASTFLNPRHMTSVLISAMASRTQRPSAIEELSSGSVTVSMTPAITR